MAQIDSLNESITQMSEEDALQLVLKIRASRREYKPKKSARKKANVPPRITKAESLEGVIANLSKSEREKLLALI